MTAPVALDRDGEWYLRGWRDAVQGVANLAAERRNVSDAEILRNVRDHCALMLSVPDNVILAGSDAVDGYVAARQATLFGGDDD
jgi:hypothetical protein